MKQPQGPTPQEVHWVKAMLVFAAVLVVLFCIIGIIKWNGGGKKPDRAPSPGSAPRFDTCEQARTHGFGPYFMGTDPEYGWYIDGDGDGIVCEK